MKDPKAVAKWEKAQARKKKADKKADEEKKSPDDQLNLRQVQEDLSVQQKASQA